MLEMSTEITYFNTRIHVCTHPQTRIASTNTHRYTDIQTHTQHKNTYTDILRSTNQVRPLRGKLLLDEGVAI
jgi:capsular polysaccharide biosynthesis protein